MKRRLKQFFNISLASIVLVVLVIAFFSWRSFAAEKAALAPIRERGEPLSIAELKPAAVADDENAATYLTPIANEIQQVVNDAYPIAYADDFSWRAGLTPEQTAGMGAILAAHPDLAGQLAKASRCTQLVWPLDYDLAPNDFMEQILQLEVRSIARFQVFRIRYLAAIDKPDEAVTVCLEEMRLIRLQADTPLLISWLVNIACRSQVLSQLNGILQTKKLLPETHAAVEQELAQHDLAKEFTWTLKTERAFGIESFHRFPRIGTSLTSQLANYLDYINEQIVIGTAMQPASSVTAIGLTTTLVPAFDNAREATNRTLAIERCVRILNAIQSRPDPRSSVDLGELGLPADAIIDPYSGQELLTKSAEDGWIIYSVGKNSKDDGGKIEPDTSQSPDIGIGPPETAQ